ncbi:hypothetical protein RRSWK_02378 [Rhodopirellula sp. SWK7]|nr:hypothetical protein RRSWK_02378 [Rhodopirellula sp. SWK7]
MKSKNGICDCIRLSPVPILSSVDEGARLAGRRYAFAIAKIRLSVRWKMGVLSGVMSNLDGV